MKKIISILILPLFFAFSGCILLLAGGAATGGYALSKDSAEGILDYSYDRTWDSMYQVFKQDGIIKLQDKTHGRLEALVGGIDMKVQVDRIGKDSTRLKIEARKNLLPKAKQAEDEFVKVMNRLKK
jgi:hypothetical protein